MNVLVCITPQTSGKRLIDNGASMVDNGELHILHMQRGDSIFSSGESDNLLQELFDYGKSKGGTIHFISVEKFYKGLQDFISDKEISHIIFGEPLYLSRRELEKAAKKYFPDIGITVVENPEYREYKK